MQKDLLESMIILTPTTATERYLSLIYQFMNNNRELLKIPIGTKTWPYFMCSNDMCQKFNGFVELCTKNNVKYDKSLILNILDNLIASYDEHQESLCCEFWFSIPKVIMKQFYITINNV